MILSRAIRPLLSTAILPLLVASLPAGAATARKARPAAAARAPVAASNAIIPLPLNPIVPAAQRLCASRTPSGLGYTVLRQGSGAKPSASDLALVNYIGYLATSGAVFDQGMRSALRVNGVIPGFSEALQMLSKTGIARFCIPAALGYGAQATGPIPANSDLIFQVELVDYRSGAGSDGTPEAAPAEPATQKEPAPTS